MAEPFSFFRTEDEELFQHAWPHVRVLDQGEKADKDPAASAAKVIDAIDPVFGVHWPRETAKRFVRAMAIAPRHKWSEDRTERFLADGVVARLAEEAEPTAADLEAFLGKLLPNSTQNYPFHAEDALFLFEAFLGTSVVLDALVTRIEEVPKAGWASPGHVGRHVAHQLGFLLRRAEGAERDAAISRARKAAAKHDETELGQVVARAIDGGKALKQQLEANADALEQMLSDLGRSRFALEHAADAPELVRKVAVAHPQPYLGARVIWIGGPELVEGYEARLRGANAPMIRSAVEGLAPLRHPAIARLMQRLLANKTAKSSASAWLAEHDEYVRGVLGDEAVPRAVAKKPARAKPFTEKKLAATLKKVITTFVKDMQKVRGNEAKERKAIAKAIAAYVDTRTLAEDPIPSAHAGHFLAADPFDDDTPSPFDTLEPTDAERKRWLDLIDEQLSTYG